MNLRPTRAIFILVGVIVGLQVTRLFPAPPVFSHEIGRATYSQSYENNYFASLRSFNQKIEEVVGAGRTPVIVLGDSTFRGTGANGENVWTFRLQQLLARANPSLSVINFSQNGGDLLAPYLFYYFHKRFPTAIFVVGWHPTNNSMARHPFHYWLTSEIILRDGRANPAVAIGLDKVPINASSPTEGMSLVMAAVNIVAPYLDLGNFFRFWFFGNLSISASHNPIVVPLSASVDSEVERFGFVPSENPEFNVSMRNIYWAIVQRLEELVEHPDSVRRLFDEEYGVAFRDRLLIVVTDLNPYFSLPAETSTLSARNAYWQTLRDRMKEVSGLNSTAMTAGGGELSMDDFVDLGHLSVAGQKKLAERVAAELVKMPVALSEREK